MVESGIKICSRCILDSSIPGIQFDDKGVCNYCRLHDDMEKRYPLNEEGRKRTEELIQHIKKNGKDKKYDCIVGFSGGCDSTYTLYMAKKMGLRILAVNFDDGWGSKIANDNMKKSVEKLGVDFKQIKTDVNTMNDWYRAFLRASVPEPDLPCDIGYLSSLYKAAADEGVEYIIVGNTFRTEGMLPLRWHYLDGRYFESIVRKFAQNKDTKDFNRCNIADIFYYMIVKKIKIVQLLVHIGYNRTEAAGILSKEVGWADTGAKHFDNLHQALVSYIVRKKFNHDWRKIRFSAQLRSKEIDRDTAFAELKKEPIIEDKKHIEFCLNRLGVSSEELDEIMKLPRKYFFDYPTYYPIMKLFKFPIKLFCKMHLLQDTLYEKLFKMV